MTRHQWICSDSMETLCTLPDRSVPCILTDVPYDLSPALKQAYHKEFQRICSGVIIVFSPPESQWVEGADQILFWIKPISTKNTSKSYSRFVEMIFVYGRHQWNCDRHWSQYTNVFTDLVDDARLHPYRKPPSLITRLILNHTQIGDTILDPFAGSGVVEDVCWTQGRNSISIERNSQYARLSHTGEHEQ